MAGGALVRNDSTSLIVLAAAQLVAVVGMFIAGFCYRERLRQLDAEPPWPFDRMLR